ncbi:cysteine dioxygenase family protein [Hoyosella rhizosphaerae]|uniref:Cysteine dioxygenase n=1 Tax=Hoyosella rhizosphaerae TaxID=1755582 RepID=A0A916UBF5_9ACTN|nr:cysteine dioxygenase family protein [Hoyosella rhizosphaerae]MBN4925925.1 cysteine dioxygenase family protein [Hoyosella rhizosphaerae]GGC66880.1 cysteine dioxygenase [Hoyosella rhizosphaerae]
MTTAVATKPDIQIHPGVDSPFLRAVLHPTRALWTPTELRGLTASIHQNLAPSLLDLARFGTDQRWWTRLALTGGVEVWLLSWAPGQGTEPHDHGGASGAFTVGLGTLDEEFRFPGGSVRTAQWEVGETVGFGPDRAHRVHNSGPRHALSVHAYSPPQRPVRDYRDLTDFTGI